MYSFPSTPTHDRFPSLCPSGPLAFISDLQAGFVYELNTHGRVCWLLMGFRYPQGIAVDRNTKDLFVADSGNAVIDEFAPPYTGSPVNIYQDPGQSPDDVAVDSAGNLGVTNFPPMPGVPGPVLFYARGSTSGPTTTVSNPRFVTPVFCAFDNAGDLYLDDYNLVNTLVGEIVGGTHGTAITPLSTQNAIYTAGGVQVAINGDISIGDEATNHGQPTIYTYKPPVNGMLTLVATTVLGSSQSPNGFTFSSNNKLALVANFSSSEAAQLYRFPSGGLAASIPIPGAEEPYGVAINPSEQFPADH